MSDFSYKNILDNNLFRTEFFLNSECWKNYIVQENIRFFAIRYFFAKIGKSFNSKKGFQLAQT